MSLPHKFKTPSLRNLCVLCASALSFLLVFYSVSVSKVHAKQDVPPVHGQAQAEADRKSSGCITCHTSTDEPTMHPTKTVFLGCTDCHGGNSSISVASSTAPNSIEYNAAKEKAHVQPRDPSFKDRSALPERTYTKWLKESPEFIKFVNPGDLRVAPETCGTAGCHASEVRNVSTSMMTHRRHALGRRALQQWRAIPLRTPHFGESYAHDGTPQTHQTFPPPTPEETRTKGVLPEIDPLERWEISQPGNVLRVFERGGEKKAEVGNPTREDDAGKPDDKLSTADSARSFAPIPFFSACRKRACSIRCCLFRARTISPATIAPAAARPATSFTRTTASSRTRQPTHNSAIRLQRVEGSDDSEE